MRRAMPEFRRPSLRSLAVLSLGLGWAPLEARAAEAEKLPPVTPSSPLRDTLPSVRLPWLILQAVPSPGMAFGETGVHGTMTWQMTPLLYSWALDRRLTPVRFFVVEPVVRQSGS